MGYFSPKLCDGVKLNDRSVLHLYFREFLSINVNIMAFCKVIRMMNTWSIYNILLLGYFTDKRNEPGV